MEKYTDIKGKLVEIGSKHAHSMYYDNLIGKVCEIEDPRIIYQNNQYDSTAGVVPMVSVKDPMYGMRWDIHLDDANFIHSSKPNEIYKQTLERSCD